jgi:hypothetical protein
MNARDRQTKDETVRDEKRSKKDDAMPNKPTTSRNKSLFQHAATTNVAERGRGRDVDGETSAEEIYKMIHMASHTRSFWPAER